MYKETCKVLSQEKVAPGHFVLTLDSQKISKNAKPGQFVQILCADSMDPLLPRPFSFLDTDSKKFAILYHVVGKGTEILSKLKKGDTLSVLGPCGNGFSYDAYSSRKKVNLVGGGVGIPPLYHFAKQLIRQKVYAKDIHIFQGARDKSLLLYEKKFKRLGIWVSVATDNGTRGDKGFVTNLLHKDLKHGGTENVQIFTCGPTAMMKAVSALAHGYGIPCQISVEVPMACGFGACLGCAVKVREEGRGKREEGNQNFRYSIACCEGPVYAGDKILWD